MIYTGFSTVTHAMARALCERWHTETSSFHLPVGEMTITLDDVYNLLHLSIQGRMLDHDAIVDWDRGIDCWACQMLMLVLRQRLGMVLILVIPH